MEYGRKNPFPATIKEAYCLARDNVKETNHYIVDIANSGLEYKPGDSLGLFPHNDPGLVDELLLKLSASGEEGVELKRKGEFTFREALMEHLTIHRANRKFLKPLIAKLPASDCKELERLLSDRTALDQYLNVRDYIDILGEYPAAKFTPQEFADSVGGITPRLYSIASAPGTHPGEVHLTVAVVRYNSFERDRAGLATGFLADRVTVDETHVPIFIQPTRGFVIPEDGSRDIIMVGPGTGIAPFRAFLEQREMDEGKGRNWLIFGEWFEKTTFFYEDEFRAWQESGVLTRLDTAFSRDQDKKIYVQHRLQQAAAEVWKWLDEGAYFYVCGDKDYMAKDVHQALIDIAQEQGGLSEEEAEHYVNRTLMKEEKRYLRDVY